MTSHSKSQVGVQNAVRGMVSLSMVIWWNKDTRSKGEDASFSQGIEDLVDVGDGELSEGVDRVKRFVVDRNPDDAVFLRNRYHRAGVRGGRRLNDASGPGIGRAWRRPFWQGWGGCGMDGK